MEYLDMIVHLFATYILFCCIFSMNQLKTIQIDIDLQQL
jgi:hypothetical protein